MTQTESAWRGKVPQREHFMQMVRRSEAALLSVARRLCRGSDDCAQDLVQDALVRAYDAFLKGQYQEENNPQAWLLRILTNGFINEYRRKSRWDAGVDVETLTSGGEAGPPATHAHPADMPGATLLEETLDEPIERALAALPDVLRITVILVDVQGLSYAEAAESLDVPIGTVRSRLSRARYLLHDLLQDYAKDRRLT